MTKFMNEVVQLQKMHKKIMEAQYQEIKRQRIFFIVEIKVLKEKIKEIKKIEEKDM